MEYGGWPRHFMLLACWAPVRSPKRSLLADCRIYFTQECRDKTRSALEFLDVDAKNVERLTPGLIGTAIAYIVLILIIYFMSLWRSFIEAAHDATGESGGGEGTEIAGAGGWGSCWVLPKPRDGVARPFRGCKQQARPF